ncbi:MAG: hypothetical protein GQ474_02920 [Sulfurimonas sp.]|nr:hypothetical protein [Sulfurimonas sp.]
MKNTLEEQEAVNKMINIRNVIAFVLVVILSIAVAFNFASFTIGLMVGLPIIAIIIWMNNNIDYDIKRNHRRTGLLVILLILVSLTAYDGQRLINKKSNIALDVCYNQSKNKLVCDEMDLIINSPYGRAGMNKQPLIK